MTDGPVVGLVLGAGSSRRLGQPKQLLEFRGRPLLQTAVDTALACDSLDEVVVAIGGAAPEVRTSVDFGAATVVENVAFTEGCSSSIVAALAAVPDGAAGIVLLLGDQPLVTGATVAALVEAARDVPLAVCTYDDGPGHPFWFGPAIFDELAALRGDKAVWKLLASGRYPVLEVRRPGPVPLDVDTWDDYERLLAEAAR